MSVDLLGAATRTIGHMARRERKKGNDGKATGWMLIGFGVVTLPVPIIGLPLIIMGIYKLCT
jgi:hypothetical protein